MLFLLCATYAVIMLPCARAHVLCDFVNTTNVGSIGSIVGWKCADITPLSNPCTWSGVNCLHGSSDISSIDLSGMGISGNLPSTISQLTSLRQLNLQENALTGTLPSAIGKLSVLEDLNLNSNSLLGSLPLTLGRLHFLKTLNLFSNNFDGTIPPSIRTMYKLTNLYLNKNKLIGHVPGTFGELNLLQYLKLDDNMLKGSIPQTLCGIAGLKFLSFSNQGGDALCYPICFKPHQIQQPGPLQPCERVAPPTVTHPLTLEYSALCEIAESLGRPGKELFGWDSCTRTFNEAFMIAVHPCIWEGVQCNLRTELNHTHLARPLNLHDATPYTPSLVSSLENTSDFVHQHIISIDIRRHHLVGRLPAAIQSLGWLRNLFLQGNSLSGHIPGELFSTHTLHTVRLDHNNFAGRVPTSVSAADLSVEFLSLSHNQLTGVIPSISSPSLTTLHLEHNLLTGSIPTTLMSSSLQYLYLQENQLSIGNSFCDVKDLQYVNISCEISVGQMQSCESTLVQQKDTGQCSAPSGGGGNSITTFVPTAAPTAVPTATPTIDVPFIALSSTIESCFSECPIYTALSNLEQYTVMQAFFNNTDENGNLDEEFCTLYRQSECTSATLTNGNCFPTCLLQSRCAMALCESFSILDQICAGSGSDGVDVTVQDTLERQCLSTFSALVMDTTVVQFPLSISINSDLSQEDIESSESTTALSSSIMSIMPGAVNVTIDGISSGDTEASGSSTRRLQSSTAWVISSSIKAVLSDSTATASSDNATQTASASGSVGIDILVTDAITAIETGVFAEKLMASAEAAGATSLENSVRSQLASSLATVSNVPKATDVVYIQTPSPTAAPILKIHIPDDIKEKAKDVYDIYVLLSRMVGIATTAFGLWYLFQYCYKLQTVKKAHKQSVNFGLLDELFPPMNEKKSSTKMTRKGSYIEGFDYCEGSIHTDDSRYHEKGV